MKMIIKIKYVKKARMWCKTTFTASAQKKEQKQEWSHDEPKQNG